MPVGVVEQSIAHESVCASGAAPPAVGATGKALPVKTAPVAVVRLNARAVFGADVKAVHMASKSDEATPQSDRSSSLDYSWIHSC